MWPTAPSRAEPYLSRHGERSMVNDALQPDDLGRLLFETSHDGIILVDDRGAPRLMNEAARAMGTALESLLSARDSHEPEVVLFHRELRTRGQANLELAIADEGTRRRFAISGRRHGVQSVLVVRELAPPGSLVEGLAEASRLESLGQFAGGLAHDFNNLLAPIAYLAHALVEELPEGSRPHELATEIDSLAERGAALVRQLLAFVRREPSEPRPIRVGEVLGELRPLLSRLVGGTIQLDLVADDDRAETLVDRVHLEHAVLNLVANARDALVDGGRIIVRTSSVLIGYTPVDADAALPQGAYVALTVVDDGSGMPAHVRERALDRFFTTKGSSGTGLGLTNVQRFATRSGGSVAIRSEPGEGTAVTIYLPRLRSHDERALTEAPGAGECNYDAT